VPSDDSIAQCDRESRCSPPAKARTSRRFCSISRLWVSFAVPTSCWSHPIVGGGGGGGGGRARRRRRAPPPPPPPAPPGNGIAAAVIDRPADGEALLALLASHQIDLIALAGYLRLLPGKVVAAYRNKILNVHPAPLPQFGGSGMYGRRVRAWGLRSTL
jgi:hypothetical protein